MSLKSKKLKQYALLLVAVIGAYHIGTTFIKSLLVQSNQLEKARAEAELSERMRKI